MRKGLLIIGVALLALGIIIFLIGIYLSSSVVSDIMSLITETRNETVVAPGLSVSMGAVNEGSAIMAVYNDSLGRPLQELITAQGGKLDTRSIDGQYVIIYVPETERGSLSLVNNYSENAVVYYISNTVSITTLIPLVLSTFVSIIMVIVSVVLLILGVVLRNK
ncbi:DUF3185 family protein [Vulcanisaeta souniana]|uniref:DUF3185 family protein n=1 Tax=Vulcanisaeta souniana TaxID=164452 RepID=UPI0006D02072|nr:DUF3185 family protein [Vulcanisaeta souniana]